MLVPEADEDAELQEELKLLLERIKEKDEKLLKPALEMLKLIIRTSTTSMTSVPKPLKYLAPHYDAVKEAYNKIVNPRVKMQCADIISVLAMGVTGEETSKNKLDCLRYCLLGTMKNIGDWGHEYIRRLEMEIVEQWTVCSNSEKTLIPLIKDIIKFDFTHNAEIQACDLLMEIDRLELITSNIDKPSYQRVCLYLSSCAKFVEETESVKILNVVREQYIKFGENIQAVITAMFLNDRSKVNKIFQECNDVLQLKQMAFITARHLFQVDYSESKPEYEAINSILTNSHVNFYFQMITRELDVLEPKTPEDVYKTWLEPTPLRSSVLAQNMDSARQNLASSFVNGFVNAGFGSDKLMTGESGNSWIYRNKEQGKFTATASLGLIHLWDVDGGLTPIDKYLYTSDEHIKGGALLALGIVNCRIKNECEPALALLADYVKNTDHTLRFGAIFGLALAYAGTNRQNVLDLLVPIVDQAVGAESLAIASLACGLIAVGTCNPEVSSSILSKLVDARESEALKSYYMRLTVLGFALCYLGCKDASSTSYEAFEVFPQPFRTTAQCLLKMCAYAGTGDVLVIQELLQFVSNRIVLPIEEEPVASPNTNKTSSSKEKHAEKNDHSKETSKKEHSKSPNREKKKLNREWDPSVAQGVASFGVGLVAMGEEIGTEMSQRIIGNMGRYGDLSVKRAMPLAIAITSVSRPEFSVIDVLIKYAHDSDEEVSVNAIFCLGLVGAGTNNARLMASLRQLAVYHYRNPTQMFMIRIAQGLTHLGKGTMTLSPLHTDKQLLDRTALAGLLIPLVALLDTHTLILSRNHYFLYAIVCAMCPRWLITLDEAMQPVNVSVRVGQAVDVVGKAGTPKTIAGIRTQTTPILLSSGERAELATEQYVSLSPVLDGICILKKVE